MLPSEEGQLKEAYMKKKRENKEKFKQQKSQTKSRLFNRSTAES